VGRIRDGRNPKKEALVLKDGTTAWLRTAAQKKRAEPRNANATDKYE